MISSCFLGKSNVDRKKKQAENISVDEGTRIRHRELSRSLSKVALMMKWKNLSCSYFYGFLRIFTFRVRQTWHPQGDGTLRQFVMFSYCLVLYCIVCCIEQYISSSCVALVVNLFVIHLVVCVVVNERKLYSVHVSMISMVSVSMKSTTRSVICSPLPLLFFLWMPKKEGLMLQRIRPGIHAFAWEIAMS